MGCRYVVILEETVIKYGCPKNSRSGGQNLEEWRQWQRVKGTDLERYFAPVLTASDDGSMLVMPRAKVLSPSDQRRLNSFVEMVSHAGYHEMDPQTDNAGEYDGRTVFIDYGYQGYNQDILNGYGTCGQCHYCKYGQSGRVEYANSGHA